MKITDLPEPPPKKRRRRPKASTQQTILEAQHETRMAIESLPECAGLGCKNRATKGDLCAYCHKTIKPNARTAFVAWAKEIAESRR